jgi:hypothetical protein
MSAMPSLVLRSAVRVALFGLGVSSAGALAAQSLPPRTTAAADAHGRSLPISTTTAPDRIGVRPAKDSAGLIDPLVLAKRALDDAPRRARDFATSDGARAVLLGARGEAELIENVTEAIPERAPERVLGGDIEAEYADADEGWETEARLRAGNERGAVQVLLHQRGNQDDEVPDDLFDQGLLRNSDERSDAIGLGAALFFDNAYLGVSADRIDRRFGIPGLFVRLEVPSTGPGSNPTPGPGPGPNPTPNPNPDPGPGPTPALCSPDDADCDGDPCDRGEPCDDLPEPPAPPPCDPDDDDCDGDGDDIAAGAGCKDEGCSKSTEFSADSIGAGGAPVRADFRQRRFGFEGAWKTPVAGVDRLTVQYGRFDLEHRILLGRSERARYESERDEARIAAFHRTGGAFAGITGVDIRRDDLDVSGRRSHVPSADTRSLALHTLQQADLDRWTVTLGARHERQRIDLARRSGERDHDSTTLSARFVRELDSAWRLGFGLDQFERAPDLEALFANGTQLNIGRFVIGNPALETERERRVTLGAEFHGERLQATTQFWRGAIDGLIFLAPTAQRRDGLPIDRWRAADADIDAIEIDATLDLADVPAGEFALRVSAARYEAELEGGGALPRLAPKRIGAAVTWERDDWSGWIGATHYRDQNEVAANEAPTEGYTTLDAELEYEWDVGEAGKVEFGIEARNLTDAEGRIHESLLRDVSSAPGREVEFKVRWEF